MRLLGIDPGLTRCGFGVVDGTVGRALTMIDVGVFRTPPDLDTSRRLLLLEQGIEASILEHHPDVVAVERVFSQHNVRTVMGTAQASGVAIVEVMRYAVVTHACADNPCRWSAMTRIAEATMVWSRAARNIPIISPMRMVTICLWVNGSSRDLSLIHI